MPKLQLLTTKQQKKFNASPILNIEQKGQYFSICGEIEDYVDNMRKVTNKVAFVIQLAYFKASGKFFNTSHYRDSDIKYAYEILLIPPNEQKVNFTEYGSKYKSIHKKYILRLSGWSKFTSILENELYKEMEQHAKQQMHPKYLLPIATNYLIRRKIELPPYYKFAEIITNAYNTVEDKLVLIVDEHLSSNQKEILDDLIWYDDRRRKLYKYSVLAKIKHGSLSTKISNIEDSIKTYDLLQAFHAEFDKVYSHLELSENATSYYSEWVKRSKLFQLKQFKNRAKAYLYLLAYLKHQYFRQTDMYIDVYLKLCKTANNRANKILEKQNSSMLKRQKHAIKKLSSSHEDSKEAFSNIIEIIDSKLKKSRKKLEEAREIAYGQLNSDEFNKISQDEDIAKFSDNNFSNKLKIELLSNIGSSLQRKLTPMLGAVPFDYHTSKSNIYSSIFIFNKNEGKVNEKLALKLLTAEEYKLITKNDKINSLALNAYYDENDRLIQAK